MDWPTIAAVATFGIPALALALIAIVVVRIARRNRRDADVRSESPSHE
jgi:hypothetical protein